MLPLRMLSFDFLPEAPHAPALLLCEAEERSPSRLIEGQSNYDVAGADVFIRLDRWVRELNEVDPNGLVKCGFAIGTAFTSREATEAALLIAMSALPSGDRAAEEAVEYELSNRGH